MIRAVGTYSSSKGVGVRAVGDLFDGVAGVLVRFGCEDGRGRGVQEHQLAGVRAAC